MLHVYVTPVEDKKEMSYSLLNFMTRCMIERSTNGIIRRIQEGRYLWEDIIQHG